MAQTLNKPRKIVMSDWSVEKLSSNQRSYAATDAWVGREIFLQMKSFSKRRGLLPSNFYSPQTVDKKTILRQ